MSFTPPGEMRSTVCWVSAPTRCACSRPWASWCSRSASPYPGTSCPLKASRTCRGRWRARKVAESSVALLAAIPAPLDPLAAALACVARILGQPVSVEALVAGLPLADGRLTPARLQGRHRERAHRPDAPLVLGRAAPQLAHLRGSRGGRGADQRAGDRVAALRDECLRPRRAEQGIRHAVGARSGRGGGVPV